MAGRLLRKIADLDVVVESIEVLNNKTRLKSIKAQGLELHLARNRDGSLNTADLIKNLAENDFSRIDEKN